jgi:hypothetical protein
MRVVYTVISCEYIRLDLYAYSVAVSEPCALRLLLTTTVPIGAFSEGTVERRRQVQKNRSTY